MKTNLLLSIAVSTLFLISCSSQKRYKNTFSENFLKNKVVIFTLNEKSKSTGIAIQGPNQGSSKTPNMIEAFKESIESLAKETKLNIQFQSSFNKSTDSEIHIDATVTQIIWNFTFSSATMKTYVKYDIENIESQYESIGSFKNMSGGSKQNNLYKSFKNANYLLLEELDKNDEFK